MSLNEIFSFSNSGFASINWSQIVMIAIGLGIIYIAIVNMLNLFF